MFETTDSILAEHPKLVDTGYLVYLVVRLFEYYTGSLEGLQEAHQLALKQAETISDLTQRQEAIDFIHTEYQRAKQRLTCPPIIFPRKPKSRRNSSSSPVLTGGSCPSSEPPAKRKVSPEQRAELNALKLKHENMQTRIRHARSPTPVPEQNCRSTYQTETKCGMPKDSWGDQKQEALFELNRVFATCESIQIEFKSLELDNLLTHFLVDGKLELECILYSKGASFATLFGRQVELRWKLNLEQQDPLISDMLLYLQLYVDLYNREKEYNDSLDSANTGSIQASMKSQSTRAVGDQLVQV
jgi:hypothetical protein